MKKRALRLLRRIAPWLAGGILYYVWIILTDIKLPCPIKLAWGLECPSCGITRMLIAVSQLDFKTALELNPFMLIALPCLGAAALLQTVRYLVSGSKKPYPVTRVICFGFIVGAVIFGIVRNICR